MYTASLFFQCFFDADWVLLCVLAFQVYQVPARLMTRIGELVKLSGRTCLGWVRNVPPCGLRQLL